MATGNISTYEVNLNSLNLERYKLFFFSFEEKSEMMELVKLKIYIKDTLPKKKKKQTRKTRKDP